MHKKSLSLVASLVFATTLGAQDFTLSQSGWHLLGATEDLNISSFDTSNCVDFVWKYSPQSQW